MRCTLVSILALLLFSCTNKNTSTDELADNMYTALLNSNTEDAMKLVQQLYEKNGVQFGALEWRYKEPTEVYNYYDAYGPRIILGRMPKAGKETQEYWVNWRKVLTNDGWDAQQFFNDEKEMQLMANYNIVVLIAHELGHYFEDYYDVEVLQPKENVNGRELFADRFSIALTNELAKADPRFAGLKQRYLELVQSMNETVPQANRYSNEQGKMLVSYPDSIMVAQPSFDDTKTMQPYASAFFQRHRVLLSGEIALPSLKEITDSVLWKKHYSEIAAMPYLVKQFDTTNKGKWTGGHFTDADKIYLAKGYWGQPAAYGVKEILDADTFSILRMDTKGKTWNVSVQSKAIAERKFQYRLVYKCGDTPEEELPGQWDATYYMLPEHLWVRSDSDFVLVLFTMDDKDYFHALHFQKKNNKWQSTAIPLAADHPVMAGKYGDNSISSCVSEDGRFILFSKTVLPGRKGYKMEWFELDKNNLQPGPSHSLGNTSRHAAPDGIAMSSDNRLYIESNDYILTHKDGKWNTLFGNGIQTESLNTDPFRVSVYDGSVIAATSNSFSFIARFRGERYANRGEILQLSW
ncbi:MAG TPA: hypothetical protein VHM26_08690 [Chitinophagaceae bacterium]|jgi:hypothetical protein|nr:hypothetical protein [Chitinophagaceae bacterium]